MINIADKVKTDTTAEIARVEGYLKTLKKLQLAVDSPRKKRKYTKKKLITKSTPKKLNYESIEGYKIPIIPFEVKEYTTTIKNNPGRPRKKAA